MKMKMTIKDRTQDSSPRLALNQHQVKENHWKSTLGVGWSWHQTMETISMKIHIHQNNYPMIGVPYLII